MITQLYTQINPKYEKNTSSIVEPKKLVAIEAWTKKSKKICLNILFFSYLKFLFQIRKKVGKNKIVNNPMTALSTLYKLRYLDVWLYYFFLGEKAPLTRR